MPDNGVFRVLDPMILIGEVEESAWYAALLEDVEEGETLGDGQTVVEVAVDDEHGGGPAHDVLGGRWVPAFIVIADFPEGAVELQLR